MRAQKFDSRQEMRVKDYEVFHYCDAALDGVAVHHHDFYEVYLFQRGTVDYSVEGRNYRLAPGDILLISPLELHQSRVMLDQPYERIVLWVSPTFLASHSSEDASLTRCFDISRPTHTNLMRLSPAEHTRMSAMLSGLMHESYCEAYGAQVASYGILLQFLVELNRLCLKSLPRCEEEDRSAPLMSQVLAYINLHYTEGLSLDSLAGQFYVSKYHLSHEFQRLVGTSVYRYIILKRLMNAKQMLTGGVSPTDVYCNCGFKDYANFYRAFKSECGMSPKEFAAHIGDRQGNF